MYLWRPAVGGIEGQQYHSGGLGVVDWHWQAGRGTPGSISSPPTCRNGVGADGVACDDKHAAGVGQDGQEWVEVDGPGCCEGREGDIAAEGVAARAVDDIAWVINGGIGNDTSRSIPSTLRL